MITEIIPVCLKNRKNNILYGTLYKTNSGKAKNILVMINPGVKGRVGPQRLYITIAKLVADHGVDVLRLDASGLGDSEGIIEEDLTRDFFLSVEKGLLVNDIEDAINWLGRKFGYQSFILGGLCGGAITALLTAFVESRVRAVIGIGLPVAIEAKKSGDWKFLISWYTKFYRDRIFHISFWRFKIFEKRTYRLLTKLGINTLFFIFTLFKKAVYRSRQKNIDAKYAFIEERRKLNPLFLKAMSSVSKTCKILIIFGQNDKLYFEFLEKYYKIYRHEYKENSENIEIHEIKDANHELTCMEWQHEMRNILSYWLENNGYNQSEKNNVYQYQKIAVG